MRGSSFVIVEIEKEIKCLAEKIWKERKQIFTDYRGLLARHLKCSPAWTVIELGVGRLGFARFYSEEFSGEVSLAHNGVPFPILPPGRLGGCGSSRCSTLHS